MILETDRLTLRRLTTDDAPFILSLLNEPSFLRFIGDRGVRTLDDARAYLLKGPIDSYECRGYGLYLTERKTDRTPIGICGFVKRDFLDTADIGFAFAPPFWMQGFAFEATSAAMTYGRTTLGFGEVAALVSPDNERSIKTLTKLGFEYQRTISRPGDGAITKVFTSAEPLREAHAGV